MSIIAFILTSGLLGLYTYISLSRLSILGNETEEVKKLYLSTFGLITMFLFILVFSMFNEEVNLTNLIKDINILLLLLSLLYTFVITWLLNKYIYPCLIKKFRENTNEQRIKHGKSKIVDATLIDSILDDNTSINYIELYKSDDLKTVIHKGLLTNYEIDNNNNLNLLLIPTTLKTNLPGVEERIISTNIYYSVKENIVIKIIKLSQV